MTDSKSQTDLNKAKSNMSKRTNNLILCIFHLLQIYYINILVSLNVV